MPADRAGVGRRAELGGEIRGGLRRGGARAVTGPGEGERAVDSLDGDVTEAGLCQHGTNGLRFAKRNGPGASGGPGSGSGTRGRTRSLGTVIQGLSSIRRQHRKVRLPPGTRALRMLAKAAAESSKNMIPKREIACSKTAAPKSWLCASASTNAIGAPAEASIPARARATASRGAERSAATTCAPAPRRRAAAMAQSPAPQPISSTEPSTRSRAASSNAVVRGAKTASIRR